MNIKTILIIDDSEPEHFLSKIAIEQFQDTIGHEVQILCAYDGSEALDLLDKTPQNPDIILLDINMPRMDGHEFLEEYNKTKQSKAPTIIMLSAATQTRDIEQSQRYDFVKDYFIKPLTSEHLEKLDPLK